jgi:hypothetical protein
MRLLEMDSSDCLQLVLLAAGDTGSSCAHAVCAVHGGAFVIFVIYLASYLVSLRGLPGVLSTCRSQHNIVQLICNFNVCLPSRQGHLSQLCESGVQTT